MTLARSVSEVIGGERERRAAELHRIDAEQQVMHDRVADERRLEDVLVRHAGRARHIRREPAERLAHRGGHQRGAARIHHRIGHAAHQILAEADLRIHVARGGDDLAARQIAQMRGDGGRADIDRETEDRLVQPGPHADDLLLGVHGDRDLPRAGAQRRLQHLQHRQIAGEVLEAPTRARAPRTAGADRRTGRACPALAPARSAGAPRD